MFVFVAFSIGVILGTLVNPFSTILSRLIEDEDKKIEKAEGIFLLLMRDLPEYLPKFLSSRWLHHRRSL